MQFVCNKKRAVLNWTTAEEVNNKGFEILRSSNGIQFNKIGWVATRTEPGSYKFEEILPAKGTYYYQLRQVDIDGKATLSPVQKITLDEKSQFNVVNLPEQINLQSSVKGSYQVTDMQGRAVLKGNITNGQNIIGTQRLVSGIYQLQILDQQGKRLFGEKFKK